MRIVGPGGPVISPAATMRRAARDAHAPEQPETEARALIAIEATAASERAPSVSRHPAAAFVAHLIATRMQAPQTRARRRAEPEEVMAAYAAGGFTGRQAAGRRLRRHA